MSILVVDNKETAHRQYDDPLMRAVDDITAGDYEVINYSNPALNESYARDFGGVILGGVPINYDFDCADSRNIDWVRKTRVPVLGICLGHQCVGRLYGAELRRGVEAEEDCLRIMQVLDEKDPLFEAIEPLFAVWTDHRASISLPQDFRRLARSETCENQIIRHKDKYTYGVQFHPELTDTGRHLLDNFVKLTEQPPEATLLNRRAALSAVGNRPF